MSISDARSSYVRSTGISSSVMCGSKVVCRAMRIARLSASRGCGTSLDKIYFSIAILGRIVPHSLSIYAMLLIPL